MANKTGVKVKFQGKNQKAVFTKEILLEQIPKHQDNIRYALKTHGKEVKTELKKVISTSVGNGVHYSNLPNRSSSEGNAPVSQSGELEDSFAYMSNPMFLKIASRSAHAKFLELGTKYMGVRPYFETTIISMQSRLYKDLQDLYI